MKKHSLLNGIAIAAITCTCSFLSCKPEQKATVQPEEQRAEILFETTMGNFKMALFNETPLHRDAYLVLTKVGYYDSLLFLLLLFCLILLVGIIRSFCIVFCVFLVAHREKSSVINQFCFLTTLYSS